KRVSTSLLLNKKFLSRTVPTGKTHLPVSAASRHSAGVVVQSLTWMVLPAGITKPRCLSAESDQSGLFTSYGITRSANFFTSVGFMQPVRLSFSSGASTGGGVHSPGLAVCPPAAAPPPAPLAKLPALPLAPLLPPPPAETPPVPPELPPAVGVPAAPAPETTPGASLLPQAETEMSKLRQIAIGTSEHSLCKCWFMGSN